MNKVFSGCQDVSEGLDHSLPPSILSGVLSQGLRLLEKVSAVLKALSFAFGAGAAGLWAVALVPGGPGSQVLAAAVVATGVAAILAAAHAKVRTRADVCGNKK